MPDKKKLTTTNVRGLAASESGSAYLVRDRDLPGFYVRRGSRSCVYYCEADYRDEFGRKRTKRVKLGSAFELEAPHARHLAMAELGRIRSGGYKDAPPKIKKTDATVGNAYAFMLDNKTLSPETLRQYRKTFDSAKAPLAELMTALLADLATEQGRLMMKALHESISEDRGRFIANRAMQNLNTVYKYALNRWDWLPAKSPTAMVKYNEERRYQVPKGVDAASIWQAIEECSNPITRALWASALLTGARPGEISKLRWADVDLDERTAIVHGTKTTSVFRYVLSERACEWIDGCRMDDEFVFVGRHKKHRDPVNTPLLPLPLGKFRNVYQAYAKKAKVDDVFLKMLVNHKISDVTQGYAAQNDLLLPDLIREQQRITEALTCGR
ncbi:MAG: tyrosine-type recombinase/integrase [Pseudomonadota bacterium]